MKYLQLTCTMCLQDASMPSVNRKNISRKRGLDRNSWFIYGFFMVHMLVFGLSGFLMAYSSDGPDVTFLYMHGGFAIFVYIIFYLAIFGPGSVGWMFINAGLGLFGIYAQIDWILSRFGKSAGDFPVYVHVIPFLYYVLYTFLLYQFVLHVFGAHRNPSRQRLVEIIYVVASLAIYSWLYFGR